MNQSPGRARTGEATQSPPARRPEGTGTPRPSQPLREALCVVPTLGASPWLSNSLEAIVASARRWSAGSDGRGAWLIVVAQGASPKVHEAIDRALGAGREDDPVRVHLEQIERPVGFAAACNRGLAVGRALAERPLEERVVAFVNDDAVVEVEWLERLCPVLERSSSVASVQGLVTDADGTRIDGLGLGFNRWLQAQQLRHGLGLGAYAPPPQSDAPSGPQQREAGSLSVLGVSATAALYRATALEHAAAPGRDPFDERLESFYEDVDLALRLCGLDYGARVVPSARARHLAGATTGSDPARRTRLVYGNRLAVLAGALRRPGSGLARALARDLLDLVRPPSPHTRRGIVAGWWRALTLLRRGGAAGGPLRRLSVAELRRQPRLELAAAATPPPGAPPEAAVSTLVVHWRTEEGLHRLLERWRGLDLAGDPRFPLTVVDNGSRRPLGSTCEAAGARLLEPGRNLGFAGAANHGLLATRDDGAAWVLILNPDILPEPGALQALALTAEECPPEVAGLAPRLRFPCGEPQSAWQLRPLPRRRDLLAQACFLPGRLGPAEEPPAGTAVEQPAAAALLVRREALELLGGLDERFFPAWFEDVDLAARLRDAGLAFRYCPAACFVHQQGATVSELGYGRFLHIYTGNLVRYARLRYGLAFACCVGSAVRLAALARLLALPLRRPRRAGNRREAAGALLALALGRRAQAVAPGGTA